MKPQLSQPPQNNERTNPKCWMLETVKTAVGVCHKIGPVGSSTQLKHACFYDDCYSDKPRDMDLLADATLALAAPELFEACRLAEIQLVNCVPIGEGNGALHAIRAAIAKATGVKP